MEEHDHDLWTGGSWESPQNPYPLPPPVHVPSPRRYTFSNAAPAAPQRRSRRAKWGFLLTLALILVLTGSLALLGPQLGDLGGKITAPWSGHFEGGDSYGEDGWSSGSEDAPLTADQYPTMPTAPTGTGTTVELVPAQGPALSNQEVYQRSLPSIVYIQSNGPGFTASGTGIVLTADGYILTNAHVVAEARSARVVLWDERSLEAKLVGWSAQEDLAVLKVESTDLTPAQFGDSRKLTVGDTAFAIGNPISASYRSTFTNGIISALDRYVQVDDVYMTLIQTTAPINFGNSGGALLNDRGQVVGVTTIKIMSEQATIEGMGFAIPSVRVKQIADLLIAGEEILPPALGVTVRQVAPPDMGLRVEEVGPDSPSQGILQVGDVIVAADGEAVRSNDDLRRIKARHLVGETMELTVLRAGTEITLSVPLMVDPSVES